MDMINEEINRIKGIPVKEKDVVDLVLSNGKGTAENDTETSPNTTASNSSEKKRKILTYYLPSDKEEVTVRLTENGKTIYEGIKKPKKDSTFEYSVNSTDDTVYEFYVDGKKLGN